MTEKRIPRRQFLRLATLGAGSSVLAACGTPTAAPPSSPGQAPQSVAQAGTTQLPDTAAAVRGKLVIMYSVENLSDEQLARFTNRHPELTVERIPEDETRLRAMLATGTPPDVFKLGGSQMPAYLAQNALLKLDDYFAASSLLSRADLAAANSFFMWDGQRLGQGDIYGMAQDWSPDFSLWINPDAFTEAGLAIPDSQQPLTYAQLAEYAAALTKKRGDTYERIGLTYETYNLDAVIQFRLAEDGSSLYSPDFQQVRLKENPGAVEVLRYYYDLSVNGHTWTPLNPSPNGWNGKDFTLGQVGIGSNGYWFSGLLRSDSEAPLYNKAIMLPAPTWGKQRYSPPYGPSGAVIAAASQNLDAAWKFFEFVNAQEPAQERAKSGWGVPSLNSLTPLMPQSTPFDKQTYATVQNEITQAAFAREINPYFAAGPTLDTSWKVNLELALRGELDFDALVENVDAELNQALKDGLIAFGV